MAADDPDMVTDDFTPDIPTTARDDPSDLDQTVHSRTRTREVKPPVRYM